ncbi:MAG: chromate efflux transporter [Chloroflexi bacterium]|nr:chromate efflux transporter [Chloroflexota bacterium]
MAEPSELSVDIAPVQGSLWHRLGELIALFFVIGATGFGGPAVLIAMMEDEVVRRRKWMSRQYFLDLVGATNLIPGPNSVEMAIHIGKIRAGIPGLFVAGFSFIVPAVSVTILIAWAYVRFGSMPAVEPFLYGVKPVIIAVILSAVWRLGKPAIKGWRLAVIGAAVVLATLLGVNEVLAMLGGGVLGMFWLRLSASRAERLDKPKHKPALSIIALPGMLHTGVLGLSSAAAASPVTISGIWWFFLKIGSVLYGSGYVLVAFIQRGLVDDLGWLTQQQLLDAVAAGQITPGPFTSTAAFVGYFLKGVPGALVAAAGIFIPSFLFAWILNSLVPKLRKSPWSAAFLDAINVSSVGLMAAVTVELAISTLFTVPAGVGIMVKWPAWILAGLAAVVALKWSISPTWLVLGGAVLGWFLGRFSGYM